MLLHCCHVWHNMVAFKGPCTTVNTLLQLGPALLPMWISQMVQLVKPLAPNLQWLGDSVRILIKAGAGADEK